MRKCPSNWDNWDLVSVLTVVSVLPSHLCLDVRPGLGLGPGAHTMCPVSPSQGLKAGHHQAKPDLGRARGRDATIGCEDLQLTINMALIIICQQREGGQTQSLSLSLSLLPRETQTRILDVTARYREIKLERSLCPLTALENIASKKTKVV